MVVSVNGKSITKSQVEKKTDRMLLIYKDIYSPDQIRQFRPQMRTQALENLINEHLLLAEADQEEINLDQQYVDDQIATMANRFPSTEEFRRELASLGTTEEELRQEVSQKLKIETFLDRKVTSSVKVTDDEVSSFYQDNSENFRVKEQVRASHILVEVLPGDSPGERAQKRKKLSSLQEEIGQGADFADLATRYSDCPSKSQGGDLEFFNRGEMVESFEDSVFKMQKGEVSDIVETDYGYHLIKLTDRRDAGLLPLEDVREKIISLLERQKKEKAVGDYVRELRNTATIEHTD